MKAQPIRCELDEEDFDKIRDDDEVGDDEDDMDLEDDDESSTALEPVLSERKKKCLSGSRAHRPDQTTRKTSPPTTLTSMTMSRTTQAPTPRRLALPLSIKAVHGGPLLAPLNRRRRDIYNP